jgi:hypothetical protein
MTDLTPAQPLRYSRELARCRAEAACEEVTLGGGSATELLATYSARARHIATLSESYWRELHAATVELCEGLARLGQRRCSIRRFATKGLPAHEYLVFDDAETHVVVGCLRLAPTWLGRVSGIQEGLARVHGDHARLAEVAGTWPAGTMNAEVGAIPENGSPGRVVRVRLEVHGGEVRLRSLEGELREGAALRIRTSDWGK